MLGSYLDQLISSHQNSTKFMYLIRSTYVNGEWFFFDIENINDDSRPDRVLWVPRALPAYKFSSEQAVEEFRAEFISPRRVEIIRMEKQNDSQ